VLANRHEEVTMGIRHLATAALSWALRSALSSALSAALVLAPAAQAAEGAAYPTRPIRLVVPGAPGTPPDVRARDIAEKLSAELGKPVVIDNRVGAGGQLALEAVMRSAPDGYTLGVLGHTQLAVMPHVRKEPFDPVKDVVPIARIGYAPILLIVNGAVPAASARELVAYAQRHPGKLNAASWGAATTPHLALELFRRAAGVDVHHVPYRDGGRLVTDLLAGEVQMAFDFLHMTRGHLQSGRLKALAVSGPQRLPGHPEIPTFEEAGIGGMSGIGGWLGIVAPAGTPPSVVARWEAGVTKALQDPAIRARFIETGADPRPTTAQEFAEFIASEHRRWGRVIADAGIRLERGE
jgi:tripartite-type tricarboxylate transporter receptor subunit TctC